MSGRAPGADDDGSGVMTILEAFRVLLTDSRILSNSQENTIEFHFYAAEEGGLLGSQDIFKSYQSKARNVVAFLQQDMTGYTKASLGAGKKENIALLTDYTEKSLTSYVKKVIAAVSTSNPDDHTETHSLRHTVHYLTSCRLDMRLWLFRSRIRHKIWISSRTSQRSAS